MTTLTKDLNRTLFSPFFDIDYYEAKERGDFMPANDIYETEDCYKVNISLAGFSKDQINLEVSDNNLIVKGERKNDEKINYNKRQTAFGKFKKLYTLPKEINEEKIDATFRDGILDITIPKDKKKIKQKHIEVK